MCMYCVLAVLLCIRTAVHLYCPMHRYVQPGKPSSQAGVYIGDGVNQDKGGRVCAVLGAGNHVRVFTQSLT